MDPTYNIHQLRVKLTPDKIKVGGEYVPLNLLRLVDLSAEYLGSLDGICINH